MKIGVIGSTGQFGSDLIKTLRLEHDVIGFDHKDLEVSDLESLSILKKHFFDVIINTAAFHKTDQCEEEPTKAFLVNTLGTRNVAIISKEIGATFVFISTDYIFNGSKNKPYTENDIPSPLNTYGVSKLAAEHFSRQIPQHYILRIASVFGAAGPSGKGSNFVDIMIKKGKNNDLIKVVDDMWMSPTYTKDAGSILAGILKLKLPYGVYHAANKGYCSWYQFAQEIFNKTKLNANLHPTKTDPNYGKATRPIFSALKSIKLSKYNLQPRHWKEALHDYLIEKGYI
ncbi:dTDP-4-dehydrorhamnose reductase [Candidatus Bathyarchaeota archaeon]|nr:dTDP-4-dehydrorhamnose reductase [Candidatus Bathyarchaeota archaeon]